MADSLSEHRDKIAQAITAADRVWLGLDFDGTLVGIADRPEQVVLSPNTHATLQALAGVPRLSMAVISGRELEDVRARVAVEAIAYSGNHGLEIEGPELHYENQLATELQPLVFTMAEEIEQQLCEVPHLLVENKRLSLSVHYRLVDPEYWPTVQAVVGEISHRYPVFRMRPGAMVWELRPQVSVNKGTAATWLRTQQAGANALPIFLGDDVTDEDGFRALPDGVTILVGPDRITAARYRLTDHHEVHEFLEWLADQLSSGQ